MKDEQKKETRDTPAVGVGVALGAGFGAVLFALTDSPVWIGVGAAIGAALGAARDTANKG